MNIQMICNTILDSCGVLILLISLLPYFCGSYGRRINRRKKNLLLYAILMHLFVLFLHLADAVRIQVLSQNSSADMFSAVSILPALISAGMLVMCILCDDADHIRIPKGRNIPVGQIACTVLPAVLARCLRIVFPNYNCFGLAWSIVLQLNQYLIQIDSDKRIEAMEQRLSRDQALLMTLQMQPHFIFNTISSIEALCQTDAASAAESLENLSRYLRSNIDALTSEALIPFDEELRHIRQYIALELADPARQFSFDYELDVRDFSLPALTVQPIVENAVKHGALLHRDGKGRVMLQSEEFGQYIRITVTDNGTGSSGLTEAQRNRRGIGIENTRKRLAELCDGSLKISSSDTGTKAVILIPKRHGG